MTRPVARLLSLAVRGVGILLCIAGGAAQRLPGGVGDMTWERTGVFVAWTVDAGALYAAAITVLRPSGLGRRALAIVLVFGAAMRATTFLSPPLLSTNVYRYVWDGRVQASGVNPYLYLPNAPELRGLRDEATGAEAIYPNINRADFAPTIYPPFAQAIFAIIAQVWPTIWGVKTARLAFDLLAASMALELLRTAGLPAERMLIYVWNPLVRPSQTWGVVWARPKTAGRGNGMSASWWS